MKNAPAAIYENAFYPPAREVYSVHLVRACVLDICFPCEMKRVLRLIGKTQYRGKCFRCAAVLAACIKMSFGAYIVVKMILR